MRRWALDLGLWTVLTLSSLNAYADPHLEKIWERRLPPVHSLRVSPVGDAVVVGYGDGRVHCYQRTGKLLWGARFKRPQRVVPSNNGGIALAFPPNQPYSTLATLLRGGGTSKQVKLDGAIVAGALTPDGSLGGAVTKKNGLYLFRRHGKSFTSARVTVRSSPRTLLAPRAGLLLVGYTGLGGVEAYGSDGRLRWKLPGEAGRVYDLYSVPDGHAVAILSYRAKTGDGIRAHVLASSGSMIWQTSVPGIYPRLALEADGDGAVVGYTEVMRSGERTGYARKLVYFDGQGEKLWEKGGLFFSPKLLGTVSPGPSVLALGGSTDLYLLGERGNVQSQYRHPAPILRSEVSWDGRAVVISDSGGLTSFLRWRE